MADETTGPAASGWAMPDLAEMQHWTWVVGRMQQMMMEHGVKAMAALPAVATMPKLPDAVMFDGRMFDGGMFDGRMFDAGLFGGAGLAALPMADPAAVLKAQGDFWAEGMALWQRWLDPRAAPAEAAPRETDRRFAAPEWRDQPLFDMVRQSYRLLSDHLLKGVETLQGVEPGQLEQIRFATRTFIDAMSPANFAFTNPRVIARTLETRGQNLLTGLGNMLGDMGRGQLTHVDPTAFEVGRNIAVTPGKVVHETPLYQLIQYDPATPRVRAVPLVIFPPWINRFYILDLNPEKSFIRWAVAQGLTVFVVSWKSADASMAGTTLDDYVLGGIVDAIDTVRDALDVPAVNVIGYCVAGTTLAATLALLAARGQADKVASATFFTAQVDFAGAGELKLFVDDKQLDIVRQLSEETGYLDGRYMALTFNLLRGRDLIWNYVVNNYLMGEEYPAFDLLHWNGDTTNLPARWHLAYLTDFYRDNLLAKPGGIMVDGVPIDLATVATPSYVQAGREDHIAPAESVWRINEHFTGPIRFVLAGSGHIAGVVNPPSSGKYQYWTSDRPAASLARFVEQATETKGSWWPDWLAWLLPRSGDMVPAAGARVPGEGKLGAIEAAPGRYAKTR